MSTPRTGVASHRLLVVVDEACSAPGVCASRRPHADGRSIEALVVAPAHGAAATRWYVDEEAASAQATRRLRRCLACLADDGIHATGELGDPDPINAIADALHEFPADEILLVTAPQRPSRWPRPGVVDRARGAFGQPIRHVVTIAEPPTASADRHARELPQPPAG